MTSFVMDVKRHGGQAEYLRQCRKHWMPVTLTALKYLKRMSCCAGSVEL